MSAADALAGADATLAEVRATLRAAADEREAADAVEWLDEEFARAQLPEPRPWAAVRRRTVGGRVVVEGCRFETVGGDGRPLLGPLAHATLHRDGTVELHTPQPGSSWEPIEEPSTVGGGWTVAGRERLAAAAVADGWRVTRHSEWTRRDAGDGS